jgi:hypothetical protein
LSMGMSSHAVCHREKGERCGYGRVRWDRAMGDEEGIFVWVVLPSQARINVGSYLQGENRLPCMHTLRYPSKNARRRMVRGNAGIIFMSYQHDGASCSS